jgi:hypothetical protein
LFFSFCYGVFCCLNFDTKMSQQCFFKVKRV